MVPALTSLKALNYTCVVLIYSVTSNSLGPWTIAHQALLSMGFSRQNTGVGCHFLLQGIFLTQGSNPHLLHWQVGTLPLSHQEAHRLGLQTLISGQRFSTLAAYETHLDG